MPTAARKGVKFTDEFAVLGVMAGVIAGIALLTIIALLTH